MARIIPQPRATCGAHPVVAVTVVTWSR